MALAGYAKRDYDDDDDDDIRRVGRELHEYSVYFG